MEALHARCAGLDIHKQTVVACVVTPEGRQTRTFGTVTAELRRLGQWLVERAVSHVVMESTGVFVRRITARAIPLARRTGSEGNPWVND
jgi:transposase